MVEALNTFRSLLLDNRGFFSQDAWQRAMIAIVQVKKFKASRGIDLLLQAFHLWRAKDSEYRDAVCCLIVRTLGTIDDPKALKALTDYALQDRSEQVREKAKTAILLLTDRERES